MTDIEQMYENAIMNWRKNKGVGTAIIPPPLNYIPFFISIIQRIYLKNPLMSVMVVTNNFAERQNVIEALTHQEIEENNNDIKDLINNKVLKIYTLEFIDKFQTLPKNIFTIVLKPDYLSANLLGILKLSKFKLVILTKLLSKNEEQKELYKICPTLEDFKQEEAIAVRGKTPIEETLIPIAITEDEIIEDLNNCDDYISTSLTIFGSFDVLKQAHSGNPQLNISATQICEQIATDNGWNPHLDMSIEFNRKIDELYNPNSLKDRAISTYEVIRSRAEILSDYKGKLEAINKIIDENKNAKILIINKRGEFASIVTEYINNTHFTPICANYHDKVDTVPAVDDNLKPVYIKSGPNKGERKMAGAKSQRTQNERLFNKGVYRVLSTSSSPDKNLSIDVDIIIITSPKCLEIENYIYRLSNITFNKNKITLFTLFCKDTIEEKAINAKTSTETHKIVSNSENVITFDENLGVIVCQ